MGEDFRSIIVSAGGVILSGVVLRLIDRKWTKERKGFWLSALPAGLGMVMIIIMVIFVYKLVWTGPQREWRVEGMVVDKEGWPVQQAQITIEKFADETGTEGRFLISYSEPPLSEVEIRVEKEGYTPWRAYVPINEFERIQLDAESRER